MSTTGSFQGRFGYGGAFGYQEDETGLKLLGHRYYDPNAGRFLTRDKVKDGRNWYAYCDNNPLRRADPDGDNWNGGGVKNSLPKDNPRYTVLGGDTNDDNGKINWKPVKAGDSSSIFDDIDYVIIIDNETGEIHLFKVQGGIVLKVSLKNGRLVVESDSRFPDWMDPRTRHGRNGGIQEIPNRSPVPRVPGSSGKDIINGVPGSLRGPGFRRGGFR